jgi:uncharacterized protein YbaA (DUF1428 family)
MAYIDGFVAAVPAANKEIYLKHAAEVLPVIREFGATRMVESWGDDVPEGKTTDFRRAVKAEPDEVIVFSWFEYPSREARNAANARMMKDPRMEELGTNMPFDGKRLIHGGFDTILDERFGDTMGYVDGSLIAVPAARKAAFGELLARQAEIFREHGASRVVDAWGDDVPDGKITDYKGAVKASPDETVVYSWIEWPSKAARDAGWQKIFADPRMHEGETPYDEGRRVYGGFTPLIDA